MSALLLALLVAAPPAQPAGGGPRSGDGPRVGLFIGSNAAPAGREPLAYAEADAERMRQVFLELGDLAPEHALILRGPSAAQILDAIARLPATPALLVFYYSGHADDRALLLGGSELPFGELVRALDAAAPRIDLRLVDACRSGALTRAKGARLGERFTVGSAPSGEGRITITSSAEWEDSQESDRLGGSFFTIHLASGLRGAADVDADGRVTLEEAYRYVYGRTVESTLGTRAGAQHPTYAYVLSGRGDLILTWTARAGGTLLLGPGHYLVLDDASGALIAEVEPRTPARLALAAGDYRVHRRTREEVWSGRATVVAGAVVAADPLLTEREAHARLVRKGGARDPIAAHRVTLSGGLRGPLDDGVGATPLFRLGYELALPWLSIEPYVALGTGASFRTARLDYDTWELGLGLGAARALDLPWVTVRGTVGVELVRLHQDEATDPALDRTTWGAAVSLGAGLESPPLYDVVATLGLEGALYAYRATDARQLPAGDGALVTQPTYRLLVGLRREL